MTFITPVGRPLYEGVVPQKPQAQAGSEPDERARERDAVTLSPAARAYLESVQPKPAPQPVREEPKPLLDETV